MKQKSNELTTKDKSLFINKPSYVVPGQTNSSFSEQTSGFDRNAFKQTYLDQLSDEINVKITRFGTKNQNVTLGGN